MTNLTFFKYLSLLLACNYFAFRVEIFDEEYAENHRDFSVTTSWTQPSLTWETFDKANAPQAFVILVETRSQVVCFLVCNTVRDQCLLGSDQPVRDKSPPLAPAA